RKRGSGVSRCAPRRRTAVSCTGRSRAREVTMDTTARRTPPDISDVPPRHGHAAHRVSTRTQGRHSPAAFVLAAAMLVGLPAAAGARAATGSVQGSVRASRGAPVPTTQIVARHLDTNFERSATSTERGFYRLSGLRAGEYEIVASNAFYHDAT